MKNIYSHIENIFEEILKNVIRKRLQTLTVVILITTLALIAVSTLRLNPKWTNALPHNNSLVNEYLKLTEDSTRGSVVYAVVEGPDKEKAADNFTSKLLKIPHVRYVFDGRINRTVNESSLIYLNNNQLQGILDVSHNLNINQVINFLATRIKQDLNSGQNRLNVDITIESWFPLLDALASTLENKPSIPPSQLTDIMFLNSEKRIHSTDNKSLLLLIGTDISEGSIDNLDEIAASLQNAKRKIESEFENTQIKLTGYPISANEEMKNIITSGERVTIWALILITVLLGIFYGGWKFIGTSIGILCIALIWTLAIIRILFVELNTVTMILGLVLIGLGIDFCIHWMNYRINQNESCVNNVNGVIRNWKSAGPPILIGAITTAGAFLSLLVLDVQSLNEFGIMSSLGIVITAILVLLIAPLTIKKINYSSAYKILQRKLYDLVSVLIAHKRMILLIFALLFIFSIWFIKDLEYEYNYAKLQTGGSSSYYLKEEIIGKFGFASDVFIHRVKGIDEADELKQKLTSFDEVGYILSISDFIPSKKDMKEKQIIIDNITHSLEEIKPYNYKNKRLNDLKESFIELRSFIQFIYSKDRTNNSLNKFEIVLNRIIESLNESTVSQLNDFNREWVLSYYHKINQLMNNGSIAFNKQPEQLRFIFQTSQPNEFVQYVYPANNTWEKENMRPLENHIANISPPIVGLSRISWHMSQKILSDILIMIIISVIIIILVLSLTQRSLKYTFLTLVPLMLGIVFTLATLVLFNIKVSLYNLISLPIVLGIGIDDGLHIVYAYRKRLNGGALNAVLKTGPAVFLTTITSMIGFGCMAFYIHPGISTLGTVTFIGVAWCFICTIFFLPILIDNFSKKANKKR